MDVRLTPGSVFVVPRGLWHRQGAPNTVTSFGVNSHGQDEISFADDPGQSPREATSQIELPLRVGLLVCAREGLDIEPSSHSKKLSV
jgi:hypothetical protein